MKVLRRCVVILGLLAAGCSQSASNTTITAPTVPTTLQAFNGTLLPQGTNLHSFTVAQTGYVEITLIGIGPQLGSMPATPITVGLAIGTPSALGTCSVIYSVNAQAGAEAQIVGTATAGPDCLTIYDVGQLSVPVNYTITVAHS